MRLTAVLKIGKTSKFRKLQFRRADAHKQKPPWEEKWGRRTRIKLSF